MLSALAAVVGRRARAPAIPLGSTSAAGVLRPIPRVGVVAPQPCSLLVVRGFYFPRKHWYPWRTRIIHKRQADLRARRHVWPRQYDPNEAPIFGNKTDNQTRFFKKDIRIGTKKLTEYAKLIRNRQLQDAIDWIESLAQMKTEPILELLNRAKKECAERLKLDVGRVYIFLAQGMRGTFVKRLRKHSRSHFGVVKSPWNRFSISVREMPLEEYFHRLYIFNKVPRSLAADMRLALHQQRVSHLTRKEWAPYLCADSRFWHRKSLQWLHLTNQFDYYEVRREWIERYKANLMRGSAEAREARGLPPLALTE